MGKSMQRESTESSFSQEACSFAQRKKVHALTQKSSYRAFKTTGRNGLKCRGKGNGCSRKTPGLASLCHMFSSFPKHITDKYFQLSEQLTFSSKISENLKSELCILISFFSIKNYNSLFETKHRQIRISHTNKGFATDISKHVAGIWEPIQTNNTWVNLLAKEGRALCSIFSTQDTVFSFEGMWLPQQPTCLLQFP